MTPVARPPHAAVTLSRHWVTVSFVFTITGFLTMDTVFSISANSLALFSLVTRRTKAFSRFHVTNGVILAFAHILASFGPSSFWALFVACGAD